MAKLFSHRKTWSQWILCYRICLLDKWKLMLSKREDGAIRRGGKGEEEERKAESVKDTTRQNIEVMRY